jgi:general secretion pathway protein F
MPVFEYQGVNPSGKKVRGSVDADNARVARQKLRAQGIFATDINESNIKAVGIKSRNISGIFRTFERVSQRELAVITRQLATLVAAGLPLVSALTALSEQIDNRLLKRVIVELREKVEGGEALAQALSHFPAVFPPLYTNLVASGEASGSLDTVLVELADYLESQNELRRRVVSAMIYPAVMLVICTLVISGLLMFLVPQIVEIFIKQKVQLPLPTELTVLASNFLINYWFILLGVIIASLYALGKYYKTERGRSKIDLLFIKAPILGSVYTKVNVGRVTRTLGALLGNGVGLLSALEITRNVIQNVHLRQALDNAREGVKEGRSLAKEFQQSGLFPAMVSHMIAVGEKSGELESMLQKTGSAYQNEVNATLSGLTSLIEPLMLVIVGVVVFIIVISVLLPMTELISVVQQ